jgi:hypothetical protein
MMVYDVSDFTREKNSWALVNAGTQLMKTKGARQKVHASMQPCIHAISPSPHLPYRGPGQVAV